jgi:GAF domain-containing protein
LSALHHLLHTLDYQAGQIYRLSPTGNDLWLYLELGPGTKPVTQNKDIFSIDESNIISDTARECKPIFVPNLNEGPYSYYSENENETESQIKSELAIPIQHGQPAEQELLGILRLQSNKPDYFDQADISLLSSLASLFASTIKNTQNHTTTAK